MVQEGSRWHLQHFSLGLSFTPYGVRAIENMPAGLPGPNSTCQTENLTHKGNGTAYGPLRTFFKKIIILGYRICYSVSHWAAITYVQT